MSSTGSTFRIGLIGAGGIAKTHAKAAAELGGRAAVAAVCDTNREAAEALAATTGARAFGSPEELLNAVSAKVVHLDGIVVCTPPSVRERVIGPALKAGLHVLVEKPLARTGAEASALLALAEAHRGAVTAVGYCHRFTPAVLEMKRQIAAGRLGRLTRFENVFAFHHPPMRERWFSDPAVSGGGSLVDAGCHSLDLFHFVAGRPVTCGAVFDHEWPGRGETCATVLVRSAEGPHRGAAGVICVGWMESARFHVRLVGTGGTLFYDYEQPELLRFTGPSGEGEDIRVETHEVRFARQLGAFIDAGKSPAAGAAAAGLADFGAGLVAAQAVDAAVPLTKVI